MNAHALPGFDSWLLRDLPGDSELDRWAETYRERPDTVIAKDYAGKAGIPATVGEHAWDDDAFMRSAELAECYARFKGHDNADAYLADKARYDDNWLRDRWESECRANERDDY